MDDEEPLNIEDSDDDTIDNVIQNDDSFNDIFEDDDITPDGLIVEDVEAPRQAREDSVTPDGLISNYDAIQDRQVQDGLVLPGTDQSNEPTSPILSRTITNPLDLSSQSHSRPRVSQNLTTHPRENREINLQNEVYYDIDNEPNNDLNVYLHFAPLIPSNESHSSTHNEINNSTHNESNNLTRNEPLNLSNERNIHSNMYPRNDLDRMDTATNSTATTNPTPNLTTTNPTTTNPTTTNPTTTNPTTTNPTTTNPTTTNPTTTNPTTTNPTTTNPTVINLTRSQTTPYSIAGSETSTNLTTANPTTTNQTTKRRRPSTSSDTSSPSKKRPPPPLEIEDEDGSLCPICLDSWTNTGEHRICALKCGHLFGSSCIERWLKSQTKKSCPTCKKKAGRADMRFIYAKKLVALDTSELINLRADLDSAIEEKNKYKRELSKALFGNHSLTRKIQEYEQAVRLLKLKVPSNSSNQSTSLTQNESFRMYMDKSLETCKNNGSRYMDFCADLDMLISSVKSMAGPFGSGYGIKKINVTNYKPVGFLHLHQQLIKDIKFHPQNNTILSVSQDKSVKITDANSNGIVATYVGDGPLWSCCWDAANPNMLYAGEQKGSTFKFDVRNFSHPLNTISIESDFTPVISLSSIRPHAGIDLPHGGLVCAKLNSLWVFKDNSSEYSTYPLPITGLFTSVNYQCSTGHLLVSARPAGLYSYARHMLCTIESTPESMNCNLIHTFEGGKTQKQLSKSCLFSKNIDYVAAHNETARSVWLWSVSTGRKVCTLPARDSVLDICHLNMKGENGDLLACLTDRKVEFFKFSQ